MNRTILFCLSVAAVLILSNTETSNADLIILGKGHAPIYVSDKDDIRFDFNNDGLPDYFVKAHYTGNSAQLYKVDYKIQDECVDGNTYDSATMKLGFTDLSGTWITNIKAWTPWFKSARSLDENKIIDLVDLLPGTVPVPYPSSGDDVIQGDQNEKNGSFIHKNYIRELGNQAGWEGSIFFNAPPGKYQMWTVHPATGISGCDTLDGFSIPIIIN